MRVGRDTSFWLAVLGAIVLLLWLLSPILLPFVLGMALGYFLDPVVAWLTGRGLSRSTAAGVLILGSVGLGALAAILVTPLVVDQAADLARELPDALATVFHKTGSTSPDARVVRASAPPRLPRLRRAAS